MAQIDPVIQTLVAHGCGAPMFSLSGMNTWARVTGVYDGDTVTLAVPIFGSVYRFSMRVNGIDTPEIKSKLPENRLQAVRARNRLLQLVGLTDLTSVGLDNDMKKKDIDAMLVAQPCIVWAECGENDKYGRVLCTLYKDPMKTESFAEVLLREKFAYAYGGGTKLKEEEQLNRA